MRLMPLLMLALTNCSSAGGPASSPAEAGPRPETVALLLPPPVTAAAQNAPGLSSPASQPAAVRDVPVYTRGQMALVLAGVELEKGDIAAARDKALERAKLAEVYGVRLEAELRATQQRASWLPWVVGSAAALFGAAVGLVIGAVYEANKRSPAQPIQNMPLELQAGWQHAAGW